MKEDVIVPAVNIPPSLISSMQAFQNYNRLKKAALTAVAYHLNNVSSKMGGDWGRMT